MNSKLCFLFLIIVVAACKKNDPITPLPIITSPATPPADTVYTNCLIVKKIDATDSTNFTYYYYNSRHQEIKFVENRGGGSPDAGWVDTFMYRSDGKLDSSSYNLGHLLLKKPYAATKYFYNIDGVLTTSNYYYNGSLVTTDHYAFDGLGRLSLIFEQSFNSSIASSSTETFIYDSVSNLSKITFKDNYLGQYTATEFSDYDNNPALFHDLMWDFDYSLYLYNYDRLLRHNPRRIISPHPNSTGAIIIDQDYSYTYQYNKQGYVISQKAYNNLANFSSYEYHYTYNCY